MAEAQSMLPDGFEDLEQYLDWSLPTERQRNQKRWAATMEDTEAFYNAMLEQSSDALDYLNQFELGDLTEPQSNLLNLCLAFVEASISVEMYEESQPKYVFPIERFIPLHDNWQSRR